MPIRGQLRADRGFKGHRIANRRLSEITKNWQQSVSDCREANRSADIEAYKRDPLRLLGGWLRTVRCQYRLADDFKGLARG